MSFIVTGMKQSENERCDVDAEPQHLRQGRKKEKNRRKQEEKFVEEMQHTPTHTRAHTQE
jgi:hypothetical protein